MRLPVANAPLITSTGATDLHHTIAPQDDINLLEIDGTDLDQITDPYFLGWNRAPTPPATGATIGFPDDKPKKIAIDLGPFVDCNGIGACPDGFGPNYWRTSPGPWDVGFLEPGSSGSSLMDQDHLVVGVLTGGVGSDCDDSEWDEFYKLDAQWPALQPYLDPGNTGAMSLEGMNSLPTAPPPPVADGTTGEAMMLGKGVGDAIHVTYDNATCNGDHAVMLWGDIGDWSGYLGDVGPDCNLGSTGSDSFVFSGNNAWFIPVWVDSGSAAGHSGFATSGPRTWTAAGLCDTTSDDPSDAVCD